MGPSRAWRITFWVTDAVLLAAGYYWSFFLRFGGYIPSRNLNSFYDTLPYIAIIGFCLVWAYDLPSQGWYRPSQSVPSILLVVALVNVSTMVLSFWARAFAFPRTVFLLAPPVQVALLCGWRFAWGGLRARLSGPRRIAVVKPPDGVSAWGEEFPAGNPSLEVAQVVDGLGFAERAAAADVVYLSTSIPRERREDLLIQSLAQGKQVLLVPDFYDILLHNAGRTEVGEKPAFLVEGLSLSPVLRGVKRLEDLLLACVAGLFALILFPCIAIAVKLGSPGPVFYRQERVGLDGRNFPILKFRTMVQDAEKLTGPVLAVESDPRITPVGRFLRATRLDELPQIINILRGEMSFVGPRPERPVFVSELSARIPAYRCRLKVKPGITGLAQVNGRYSTDPVDKLRYDLYYIRNYSPLLDLRILFQTVRTVLSPAAAEGVGSPTSGHVAG